MKKITIGCGGVIYSLIEMQRIYTEASITQHHVQSTLTMHNDEIFYAHNSLISLYEGSIKGRLRVVFHGKLNLEFNNWKL